jgi:hypothetical protein
MDIIRHGRTPHRVLDSRTPIHSEFADRVWRAEMRRRDKTFRNTLFVIAALGVLVGFVFGRAL